MAYSSLTLMSGDLNARYVGQTDSTAQGSIWPDSSASPRPPPPPPPFDRHDSDDTVQQQKQQQQEERLLGLGSSWNVRRSGYPLTHDIRCRRVEKRCTYVVRMRCARIKWQEKIEGCFFKIRHQKNQRFKSFKRLCFHQRATRQWTRQMKV